MLCVNSIFCAGCSEPRSWSAVREVGGVGCWRGEERKPGRLPITAGSLSLTNAWWPWSGPPLVNMWTLFLCGEGLDAAYSRFWFSFRSTLYPLSFCWLHHLSGFSLRTFDLLSSLVLLSSKGIEHSMPHTAGTEHSMSHTAGPLHLYVQPIIDGKCCRKGIRSAVTYVAAFLVLSEVTKDGRYLHSLHAVFG